MHRRAVALVSAAAVLLAACSSGGSSPVPAGSEASGASSIIAKGVAPDTSAPSTGASSPTGTSGTPTSTAPTRTRASTPPPGLRDFRDVTYSVPSGFTETSSYHPQTPLESDYTSHYLVPTDTTNTKEVIGLYVYTLPAAKTVTSRTDQLALIKTYNVKSKAVVSGSIRAAVTSIDGLPAYTETATEPGNLTYIAYWAFGTHHFLQFSCQLGSTNGVAGLAVACGTTLASLHLD